MRPLFLDRDLAPSDSSSPGVPTVMLFALLLSVAIWVVPGAHLVLLPIRPYLTFVHEGWHALVAVLSGGHVRAVHVFGVAGGGVTSLSGGATLLIASAGYVGSAVTGATFLALLPHPRALRGALSVQYAWLVDVAARWDHDVTAWLYLLLFGLALFALAVLLPRRWFAVAMGFLALQLALGVLGDLRTLLLLSLSSGVHSDAMVAADVTHLPPLLWAIVWSAVAGLLLLSAFRLAWSASATRRSRL